MSLDPGPDSINSDPVGQDRGEAQRRKEVLRELIVACCDPPKILKSAEAALDDITLLVGFLVVAYFLFAVGLARDDGLDAALLEESSDRIGVIAFVGEQFLYAGDEADAVFGHYAIRDIAGRQDESPGPAKPVNYRMDLAVAAALGNPDRLKIRPPFPPLAQRWTFTWLLSNATCSGGSQGAATDSKIFCQMPRSLQREKRL